MKKVKLEYIFHSGVIILLLFLSFNSTYYRNENIQFSVNKTAILIKNHEEIKTEFVGIHDNFDKIGCLFATYENTNMEGSILIQLKQENKVIVEKYIDIINLRDNMPYYLDFPIEKNSNNKTYELIIYGTDIPENTTLAVWGHANQNESRMDLVYFYKDQAINVNFIIYLVLYMLIIVLIKILNMNSKNK